MYDSLILFRVLQNNCIKLRRGIEEPKIMGVARAKKIRFSFANELWAFEIEKLKDIFIKISKTIDLNLTKVCTLTLPATLFPMMNPFL